MESNNSSEIQRFLKEVASINLKYETFNKENVNNFNIFSVIRKGTEEVGLHSRFIGELLDPKGSHNKEDIFLKLFIKQLDIRNIDNEVVEGDFNVGIEQLVGDDGRIDLFLESRDELIIIENKIYAADQDGQLQRYSHAAKSLYGGKNAHLLYLTLYGVSPSGKSLKGESELLRDMEPISQDDVRCISYGKHILPWLELCIREVYDMPHLRETLVQYKKLVEKLTGKTINKRQQMDITKLLLNDYNFEHALKVEAGLEQTKIEIQKLVWSDLQIGLKESGFDFSFVDSKFNSITTDICNDFFAVREKTRLYGLQTEILKVGDYSVHLYIEVDTCLYFGLTVCKNDILGDFNNDFRKNHPLFIKALSYFRLETIEDGNRWIGWKYTTEQVDFRNFNQENSAKIANATYRHNFINESIKDICGLIDHCIDNEKLLLTQ
jgi:hypothetical protein